MKVQGIYAIRHVGSGRMYIGSAVNIAMRWHIHRHHLRSGTHHSRHLQTVWTKAGAEAFEFSILEIVTDKADLIAREQWWIDETNACFLQTGFNCAPLAGNVLGIKRSAETKAKISALRRDKPFSADALARIGAAAKGRVKSPEGRARISAANTGRKHTQEALDKITHANRNRSPETLAKMGAAHKGKSPSLDIRERISLKLKGRVISPEVRARMAAALVARWARWRAARSRSLSPDQVEASPVRPRRVEP